MTLSGHDSCITVVSEKFARLSVDCGVSLRNRSFSGSNDSLAAIEGGLESTWSVDAAEVDAGRSGDVMFKAVGPRVGIELACVVVGAPTMSGIWS